MGGVTTTILKDRSRSPVMTCGSAKIISHINSIHQKFPAHLC